MNNEENFNWDSQKKAPRFSKKKIAAIIGIIFILTICVILWQLPAIAGTSWGLTFIEKQINTDPTRKISIGRLDLKWSGTQRVTNIRIVDQYNSQIVNLQVKCNGSLIKWARGSRDFGTVFVSGEVDIPRESSDAPIVLPPGLKAEIILDNLNIKYPESEQLAVAGIDSASLEDISGYVTLETGKPLIASIRGITKLNDNTGSINVEGQVNNLIATDGSIATDNIDYELKVLSTGLPTRLIDDYTKLGGQLTDAIGEMIDLDVEWAGSTTKGTASVNVQSANTNIDLNLILADQRLTTAKPGVIKWSISQDMIEKLPAAEAMLDRITLDSATMLKLTINSLDYGLPLSDNYDMSKDNLSATLSLDSKLQADMGENLPSLQFDNFVINIVTTDPTDVIKLSLDSELVINDMSSSNNNQQLDTAKFDIKADITHAFGKAGQYSPDTLGLAGKLSAHNLPIAIADSFTDSDKLFVDLLGPALDQFEISTGLDSLADIQDQQQTPPILFTLSATTANLTVNGGGVLKNGTIYSEASKPLDLTLNLSDTGRQRLQNLASQYQSQVSLNKIDKVKIHFNNFSVPLYSTTSNTTTSFTNSAWDGDVHIDNLVLAINDNQAPASEIISNNNNNIINFSKFSLHTVSANLLESTSNTLNIDADYQNTAANITGQIDVNNPIDSASRDTNISIIAENLDAALIDKLAGLSANINEELLGNNFSLQLKGNISSANSNSADMKVTGQNATLDLAYSESSNGSGLIKGISKATITPELMVKIQSVSGTAAADSAVLLKPVSATVNFDNITLIPTQDNMDNAAPAIWKLTPFSINAALSTIEATNIPGLQTSQQLGVDKLNIVAASNAGIGDNFTYSVNGTILDLQNSSRTESGLLQLNGNGSMVEDKLVLAGKLNISSINLKSVEHIMQLAENTITKWAGNTANINLDFDPLPANQGDTTDSSIINNYKVSMVATSPRLTCDLAAQVVDDSLTFTQPGKVNLAIDHKLIQSMLEVPKSSNTTVNEVADIVKQNILINNKSLPNYRWEITDDINVTTNITKLSLPVSILKNKQIVPTLLNINGDLRIAGVSLSSASHAVNLNDFALNVTGDNLANGINVKVGGKSVVTDKESQSDYTGNIDLTGTVKSLSSTLGEEIYNFKGNIDNIPVAIIDNLAHLGGKLTAALGPTVNVKLQAEDSMVNSGAGSIFMTSENGKLNINKASWKDNILTISEPVYAELNMTDEMSNTLLNNVNPMLYDIKKKSGPISLNVSALQLPFNGDLKKLNADAILDLGLIDVPSNGLMSDLLGNIGTTKKDMPESTSTTVPPVHITITNGKLHHDQLVLQSDKFEIITGGDVYLADKDKPLDLKLAMQLMDWKNFMSGVPSFGGISQNNNKETSDSSGIRFYFLVKGTVADPKPMPDPAGHIKVMEDLGKDAKELLKDKADDVLGNIFKNKK